MRYHVIVSRFGGIGAPTEGHDHSIKQAEEHAGKDGGRVKVFMGASTHKPTSKSKQAKKTPVPVGARERLARMWYPHHDISRTKNPVNDINALHDQGHEVHLHVDHETAQSLKDGGLKIPDHQIHPVERIASKTGEELSGTAQRGHVLAGRKQKFKSNLAKPRGLTPEQEEHAKETAWKIAKRYVRESKSFAQLREELEQYK